MNQQTLFWLDGTNFTNNLWGGNWIQKLKGLSGNPKEKVGESWEFSVHPKKPSKIINSHNVQTSLIDLVRANSTAHPTVPFLLKFVDACDNLSLQVHPSDAFARKYENESGKAEAWFVLDVEPGQDQGYIYIGFNESLSVSGEALKEKFYAALQKVNQIGPTSDPKKVQEAQDFLLPFVNRVRVQPGDVIDLPPGTLHSIGKGLRVFEIQQSSDLTYRIWDWNRPDPSQPGKNCGRPLHIEKAMSVLEFVPRSPQFYKREKKTISLKNNVTEDCLIENKDCKFAANKIYFKESGGEHRVDLNKGFFVLTGLKGRVSITAFGNPPSIREEGELKAGFSVFIPTTTSSVVIKSLCSETALIKSYVP